jgi:hypothetical protein
MHFVIKPNVYYDKPPLHLYFKPFLSVKLYSYASTQLLLNDNESCRSQWPRGLRCGSEVAGFLGLWFQIPPGAWMLFSCKCCVLSGRCLCDGLITRPEKSHGTLCFLRSVIVKHWQRGNLGPLGAVEPWGKKVVLNFTRALISALMFWNVLCALGGISYYE